MKDLVSRSTFAYAALLFGVLFAPLAGKDPNGPDARTLSVFPDGFTLLAMAAIVFFCVQQSLQNRPAGEPRFRRALYFTSVMCGVGAVLEGIAVAGLGPGFFENRAFVLSVAAATVVVIWLTGTLMAAVFAAVLLRVRRTGSADGR